jgi:hypothetical protein
MTRYTRYPGKRPPREKSKHGRAIFLIWVLFSVATEIFRYFTPADRNDDAVVLFCVFSIIACIMWITDNVLAVGTAFTPFIVAALIFEIVSSSKDRAARLIVISLFPLVLIYALFGSLVFFLPLWAIVSWLPFVLYRCSFRRLMVRLPRYRRADIYENSKLCNSCRNVLNSSSLLLGSWTILIRTEELHPFYGSIEEMQRSWQGCNLCEALLSQNKEDKNQNADEVVWRRDYGTISSAASFRSISALEKGALAVRIQLHEHSSFRDAFSLQFTIKLETPDTNNFRELRIGEGVCF